MKSIYNFMMRIIFFIIFLSNFLKAQSDNNYIDYYKKTNDAELAILRDDYSEAIEFYLTAFKNVNVPFSVDCLNAAKIASIMNKDSLLYLFLTKAVLSGVKIKTIEGMKYFKKQGVTNTLKDYFKQKNILFEDEKKNFVLSDLKNQIDSLYEADQAIRRFKRWKDEKRISKMNYIDSCVTDFIIKLLETNSFPFEYQIQGGDLSKAGLKILLLHNITKLDSNQLEKLEECVKSGKLHPQYFSHFIDRRFTDNNQSAYYYYYYTILGDLTMISSKNTDDIMEINKRRLAINLLELEQAKSVNEKLKKVGLNLKFL